MVNGWTFQLCHTLTEGNMCADFLVKLRTRPTNDLLIVLNPSAEVRLLLKTDNMDVAYHRSQ
jgi:hypothetical protein